MGELMNIRCKTLGHSSSSKHRSNAIGCITSERGLKIVENLCKSENGVKHLCVLAFPTVIRLEEETENQLEKLERQGVNIVARARRTSMARSKLPESALLVAPPGTDGKFNMYPVPDLWVYTTPNNWASAVLRTAGVLAEYSCDHTKYPLKESVLKLGQKRGRRSKPNFLVLEPLNGIQFNSVKPRPWFIKAPVDPWIDSSPPKSNDDITTDNFGDDTALHSDPPEPHPRLPGLRDIFPEEIWNPGYKRVYEDPKDNSRRPKKIRRQ
ncbi:hypothetical protein H0H93_001773 [Arthromyces matolae]|nr:hypothetical protein H0H93_001773 [Arthromyces matolae]